MTGHIRILDTTLTDGFSSAGIYLMAENKLTVARLLEQVGVDIIEAGYPSRSAADFAGVQVVAQCLQHAVIAARARIQRQEIDQAYAALQPACRPRLKLCAPTSPMFVRHTLGIDEQELLRAVGAAVHHARSLVDDVQFTAEDASRTDWHFLAEVCVEAISAGAKTVVIQDSVGQLTPKEFYDLIRHLREHVPPLANGALGVDCRHDLGLALANALGAVERGVDQVECAIGGMGFPLGQVPLEAFVTALRSRPDRYHVSTKVQSERLHVLSETTQDMSGVEGVLWGRVLRDAAFGSVATDFSGSTDQSQGEAGRLNSFSLTTNEAGECLAEVTIRLEDGSDCMGTAQGSTQIEALHQAIAKALHHSVRVVDHVVNHLRHDCKEVLLCLEDGNSVVTGRATASAVLRASAEAYLNALGQLGAR